MAVLKDYALTTVADVKENLGIASSDSSKNNLIIRKINQATGIIENYCGRRFKSTAYTDELYNGNGTDQLVLRQRPIIGSVTLESRDTSLNEADFDTVDSELYFIDTESGILNLNFRSGGHWGRYAVTYTAGYETIPDDLAEACASLAAYLVTNADSGSVNVSSKQEGQRKVTYSQSGLTGVEAMFQQLGIDETINAYANTPVFAEK